LAETAFLRLLRETLADNTDRLGEKFGSSPALKKHFKSTPVGEIHLYDDLSGFYSIIKAIDDELAAGNGE